MLSCVFQIKFSIFALEVLIGYLCQSFSNILLEYFPKRNNNVFVSFIGILPVYSSLNMSAAQLHCQHLSSSAEFCSQPFHPRPFFRTQCSILNIWSHPSWSNNFQTLEPTKLMCFKNIRIPFPNNYPSNHSVRDTEDLSKILSIHWDIILSLPSLAPIMHPLIAGMLEHSALEW